MNLGKNIALKVGALGLIILASNFIYSEWFFEKDLQAYSPDINTIREIITKKAEVVYCGESSNISFFKDDNDKRFISQFLNEELPKTTVIDFSKKAGHAGIYYDLLRAIPRKNSVETIIITMNLRSFGPDWINSNLETPLQKEMVLLRPFPPLVNRFLLGFKNYDTTPANIREKRYKYHLESDKLNLPKDFPYVTASEWEKDIIKIGEKVRKELKTAQIRELASQYIKSYAFRIDPTTNPRIKDFDKIVDLAKNRGWKIVFHILPENVDRAEQLAGKKLVEIMTANSKLLQNRYLNQKVIVVDNLSLLQNDQFIDQDWTSEHYKEHGRRLIAKRISAALLL
jgi:hypothetical protein